MTQVHFPYLGITINVNPVAFRLGNFEVYWYGILIGIGFLLAVLYGFSSCKKTNLNKDHLFDAVIAGLIGGVIGARLYYVAFYPGSRFVDNPMEIFAIHEGGLGIYGGIIGGLLCGGLVAKWRKMSVPAVLDVASTGFFIGQSIGRWGNFINQEAFGRATDLPWGMYSAVTALEVEGYVHPCFLYESLLCALGFLVLHIFTRYFRQYDGQTFLLYILWYGVSRFFIEGVRTDSLLLPGVDLRVSQVVAAGSVCVSVILLILGFVFKKKLRLTGCGSRKAMKQWDVEVVEKVKTPEIDETAESTLFSGMSTEEVEKQMAARTRKLKITAEEEETEAAEDAEPETEIEPENEPEAEPAAEETEVPAAEEGEETDGTAD